MPTIEANIKDLEMLLDISLPRSIEKLDSILSNVKGETKLLANDELHVEIQDTNRPDLWCVEGIARALAGFLDLEKGLKRYQIKGLSGVEVRVDPSLENIRPYIGCAVVKNIEMNDDVIRQIINLQEKMDQTYGRKRKKTSIGLYDFDLVFPPLIYTVAKPKSIKFVPLDSNQEMTLEEILNTHPKGLEYGPLVRMHGVWPIFMDSRKNVLSFPPIINSNDLGKITQQTKNILKKINLILFMIPP